MLKTSDLQSLKKHFQVKSFKKGEVIFPQGQVANGAYIVIKGLVHLKKKHGSRIAGNTSTCHPPFGLSFVRELEKHQILVYP